jgi:hypothetical protein
MFRGLLQSVQVNAMIVPQNGWYHLLTDRHIFIVHDALAVPLDAMKLSAAGSDVIT